MVSSDDDAALVPPTSRQETRTDEPTMNHARTDDGHCPDCGGTAINVQGLLDCSDCGFRG